MTPGCRCPLRAEIEADARALARVERGGDALRRKGTVGCRFHDCRLASPKYGRGARGVRWNGAGARREAATVTAPVKEGNDLHQSPEPKRLGIVTVAVERRAVARTRNVGGEIVAPSGNAVAITAPTAGVLQAPGGMPVAGSAVTKGQMLFRLVPLSSTERESPVVAQQAIDIAAARREAASRRVQRAEQLLSDGAGSRRQLEEAQAELAIADAELSPRAIRRALAGAAGPPKPASGSRRRKAASSRPFTCATDRRCPPPRRCWSWCRLDSVGMIRVPIYAGESRDIDPKLQHACSRSATRRTRRRDRGADAGATSANATTAGVDLYYAMSNTTSGARFRPASASQCGSPAVLQRRGPELSGGGGRRPSSSPPLRCYTTLMAARGFTCS